ncbi:MAG: hypothetical protein AABZ55_15325, partial [Bdellovibrionota bacterium]
MKKGLLALLVIMSLSASACRECTKAQEKIIGPINLAQIYMDAEPSPEALASNGCRYLVFQLQYLTEASEMLREYAMSEYSPEKSHCTKWVESTRYVCSNPEPSSTCQWTPFSRCEGWIKATKSENWNYDSTMKLADYLDGLD